MWLFPHPSNLCFPSGADMHVCQSHTPSLSLKHSSRLSGGSHSNFLCGSKRSCSLPYPTGEEASDVNEPIMVDAGHKSGQSELSTGIFILREWPLFFSSSKVKRIDNSGVQNQHTKRERSKKQLEKEGASIQMIL